MRSAAGLPHEVPENPSIAGINGPAIVGTRRVENPVDHQNGSDQSSRTAAAVVEFTSPFSADDVCDRRSSRAESEACPPTGGCRQTGINPHAPRQGQTLHVALIDLRERAV